MITTRREFLRVGALSATGLVLGVAADERLGLVIRNLALAASAEFRPNAFVRIASDGKVTLVCDRCEMGQGVRTSLPMLLAEELDVDMDRVQIEQASPSAEYTEMRTSGSGSVIHAWQMFRQAGAAARRMLVEAAAEQWKVAPDACKTARGEVLHPDGKKKLAYGALVAAAAKRTPPKEPVLKPTTDYKVIGQSRRRHDGPQIVTGEAKYGLDVRVPGMKHAALVRPPVKGATLGTVDEGKARRVPGLIDVVHLKRGVAVVANTTWAAIQGRDALAVTWDLGENAAFDSDVFRAEMAQAVRGPGQIARVVGEPDGGSADSAKQLEAIYEYPFYVHAPLEPMNATAHVTESGCEIWVPTQAPNQVHTESAALLGIDPSKVRVHMPLAGGGFGRRLGTDYALEAVELSRAIKAPVQITWTRQDDTRNGFFQPAWTMCMKAGLDAQGKIVSWLHRAAGGMHNYRADRPPQPDDPERAADYMWGGTDNPYLFPTQRIEHMVRQAPLDFGPWRAVHYPPNLLARECFIDEIAHETKQDPLAVRLAFLQGGGGTEREVLNRTRLAAVLNLAAEKAGWGKKLPAGRGLGIAANVYHGMNCMAQVAELEVRDGRVRVHRIVCAVDCGIVVNPIGMEGQVESAIAWGLSQTLGGEITVKGGRVEQSSYADYPVLMMADAPVIEVHVRRGREVTLGIGEQPVPPVAPAVLNAIFAATGKRIRHLPVREKDLA